MTARRQQAKAIRAEASRNAPGPNTMTRNSISQMRHTGTGGQRRDESLPFVHAQTMLEGTVLLSVEEAGYPVLIAGRRFADSFPRARPGVSFLALAHPDSRGRLVAALETVASRQEPVTVTCVRAGRDGPHWIEIGLEPLLVAPGSPPRVLGRLMTSATGPASERLQVLSLRLRERRQRLSTQTPASPHGGRPHLRIIGTSSHKG